VVRVSARASEDPSTSARPCEGCHVAVAREWRGSQHQRAYVDADFAESLAREPSAFCRSCHAAEADPTRAAPAELAALGVACVTCHMPGDAVLAGPVRAGAAEQAPQAPHALRRSPGFAEAAACGRCHALPVVAASGSRIYATVLADFSDGSFTVFAFDGSTWTTLPTLAGAFAAMDIDRDGSLWVVAGGALSRIGAAGVWESQAFPTAAVKRIGGLREPIAWVTQADGALWLRQAGQTFTRIELPPPLYSATEKYAAESVTSAGTDFWVTATYEEKRPGRKGSQTRRALLHNGPRSEPLRCTEVTTHSPTRGMHTWPPAAHDDCATPYAILLRASTWTPKKFPYIGLGKALKGQQAFATAKFSEIELGGQKLVGAAVPTVAEGRALVEHIARKVPRSQPELVCATPTELRPLPFDLATGTLAP